MGWLWVLIVFVGSAMFVGFVIGIVEHVDGWLDGDKLPEGWTHHAQGRIEQLNNAKFADSIGGSEDLTPEQRLAFETRKQLDTLRRSS
jgi:hypothetical protein